MSSGLGKDVAAWAPLVVLGAEEGMRQPGAAQVEMGAVATGQAVESSVGQPAAVGRVDAGVFALSAIEAANISKGVVQRPVGFGVPAS